MLFSQLSKRQSLRDLTDSFNSLSGQHYHLGVKEVYRSSLSDANKKRINSAIGYITPAQKRQNLLNVA